MTSIEASRTLVKSPPELWAECSEASNLARHLGQFGEIRITRLEPENAVAWEGTIASGTVRLEPSGWGTKVILTAEKLEAPEAQAPEATVEPEAQEPGPDGPASEPEPVAVQPVAPAPRRSGGLFGRLFARFRAPEPVPVTPKPEPVPVAIEPEPEPEPMMTEPEPVVVPEIDAEAVLISALDSLGQAHHRPFSRG